MTKIPAATIVATQPTSTRVTFEDGTVFELATPLAEALRAALTTDPNNDHQEMTTSEAAAFLNVSRTTITKMIDGGRLPARLVGTHRRILLSDVVTARNAEIKRRSAALDELLETQDRYGLYDTTNKHPLR